MAIPWNDITLFSSCGLGIVLTIVLILGFIFYYWLKSGEKTAYPWCYNDWKCNAPSEVAALSAFNAAHAGPCDGVACNTGQTYNAYASYIADNNETSDQTNKCKLTEDSTDVVVIDLATGCLCKTTVGNVICTKNDMINNVAGCEATKCGLNRSTCGQLKVNSKDLDGNAIVYKDAPGIEGSKPMVLSQWRCDGSSGPALDVETICSYRCPADFNNNAYTADDFRNVFAFRLEKDA